jgi:hypothetical protein
MAHIVEQWYGGPDDTWRPNSQGVVDCFVPDESAFCRTTGFV